jgi:hypothetical protein
MVSPFAENEKPLILSGSGFKVDTSQKMQGLPKPLGSRQQQKQLAAEATSFALVRSVDMISSAVRWDTAPGVTINLVTINLVPGSLPAALAV